MGGGFKIKSVAIIGAGAAGTVTAAALKAENYFERIRVFERRETTGGTWIYDPDPSFKFDIKPGGLPPDVDPPLEIPRSLPRTAAPSKQERFTQTPIYESLTTNVPDIAMCFSDARFAYGPFAPHYIPRQYVENYASTHKLDSLLSLNTTVEDVSRIDDSTGQDRWRLSLRRFDRVRNLDEWWEEVFDAVIIANGHYSIPYVPEVKGLAEWIKKFPDRVVHSKSYRLPSTFAGQKVLVIGNSASGHDVANELTTTAALPVYQSRRSKSRWDGDTPPDGIEWRPVIAEFKDDGGILFEDGSVLRDIDKVIYCTGYKPSFPFWNSKANRRELWDYEKGKLIDGYQHTFLQDIRTVAIVGLPRVLTFRSFEYQAIAIARLFSRRNSTPLPPIEEQKRWERSREEYARRSRTKFHDIAWETGETLSWFQNLFEIAGLGTLRGEGRVPPVMGEQLIWALEHIKKYPEPGNDEESEENSWAIVNRERKDLLSFI
ncbi:hypothetical protein BGZ63DRAFT_408153 [Mariannaea sp. PMI_226]|nr:hypothetical protein BGZ63DRAFT_408153 [Mariannaea sp. PMI_226]